jgi:DNA-binding SARP family transcriptional activator
MSGPDDAAAPPPRVLLFGTPEVVGATGPTPTSYVAGRAAASHTARATELIAYLATRRAGVTTAQLAQVHSPDVLRSPATLHSLVSRMRRWLGNDQDGVPFLPRAGTGHLLALDPRVRTDWEDFQDLTGPSPTTTSTESLAEGLRLVRGQPIAGIPFGRWGWADDLRQELLDSVGSVCHELVERHVARGDLAAARRVAAFGRTLDPADEAMWRAALTIELRAGDAEAQRRLIAQLVRIVDRREVEPATAELLDDTRGPVPLRSLAARSGQALNPVRGNLRSS